MKGFLIVALFGLACASPLVAQQSRIRQGNHNHAIYGQVFQELRFTTTGYLSDQVLIAGTNVPGGCYEFGTIASLMSSPLVHNVVWHSGGQVSLRWRFQPYPCLMGGFAAIFRGNAPTDIDPVYLSW